jgi:hypothetical protein
MKSKLNKKKKKNKNKKIMKMKVINKLKNKFINIFIKFFFIILYKDKEYYTNKNKQVSNKIRPSYSEKSISSIYGSSKSKKK